MRSPLRPRSIFAGTEQAVPLRRPHLVPSCNSVEAHMEVAAVGSPARVQKGRARLQDYEEASQGLRTGGQERGRKTGLVQY